jgi:hypothetical protein
MPVSFSQDVKPMFREVDSGPFWTPEQLALYDKWRIDGYQP